MKRFLFGYVAGALSLFLGLAVWNSYTSARAMERFRTVLQEQIEWMKHAERGPGRWQKGQGDVHH